jgi:hypothetical protein
MDASVLVSRFEHDCRSANLLFIVPPVAQVFLLRLPLQPLALSLRFHSNGAFHVCQQSPQLLRKLLIVLPEALGHQ